MKETRKTQFVNDGHIRQVGRTFRVPDILQMAVINNLSLS